MSFWAANIADAESSMLTCAHRAYLGPYRDGGHLDLGLGSLQTLPNGKSCSLGK
jgi:hypothetical protein